MILPKKILCLHQGDELYGSDRSFLSAVEALHSAGAEIDVILPKDGELAKELRKVKPISIFFYIRGVLRKRDLKSPLNFVYGLFVGFFYYLNIFRRYPIVYINTVVMASALMAASCYRFSSKRVICHVREIPRGWQLRFFRTLLLISGAELVFNSGATRRAFGLRGKVIYNGVSRMVLGNSELDPEKLLIDGRLKLLLIGRINQWKGQLFLIEALAAFPVEIRKRLQVRIVGSPFEGYDFIVDEIKNKINEYGLDDVVSLTGFCPDPAIHYGWADYIVVASTQPEPFGRVAIEAFSCGKPVLAAGHGGLTEIVEHGVNGFLFEPNNLGSLVTRISEILSLPSERYSKLSCQALQRFNQSFSIEKYQGEIRDFFGV